MQFPELHRFLATNDELKPVVEKAIELSSLSRLFAELLPAELGDQVRVVNFKEGRIIVAAANPAAAAKIRLYGERLAAQLSSRRKEAIAVSVKVQPNISHRTNAAAQHVSLSGRPGKSPIPSAALRELRALYRRLPDSPARRALLTLLKHQGEPGSGSQGDEQALEEEK